MCDRLKVSQIIKILNLYTPADEYEERVTPTFVRKIQAKLSARAIVENQEQVREFRVRHCFSFLYSKISKFGICLGYTQSLIFYNGKVLVYFCLIIDVTR